MADQKSSFEPKPFGRYVLLEKLAVGGMAEIYKAKTYGVDGFEKQLVIKRILPHCAADADFIKMLVDEAKLTVLLSHANIVQVYDLGKVGDDYFISMEFIHGTNLRDLISRLREKDVKLSEELAVYIISEVCKGLDYAHRKSDPQGHPLNIVHRDISPQNILISYEGEVKIVDFGIAKAAMNVSHTMAGILKGKVSYMSPEQSLGKPIDHRTDIFSTGIMLYEMLAGDKLFSGETQFEVLNQIRTTRVNTLMLPDHIPGPLKAILAKALAYNAKDRYQSAGDLQLDLTKYLYSSYVDFSPRQLASILSRQFEGELKRKEEPVVLNEHTRSIMLKQVETENIVVHNTTRLPLDQRASSTESSSPSLTNETSASLIYTATERQKSKRPLAWIAAGLLVLLTVSYFGYRYVTSPENPSKNGEPDNGQTDIGSIQITSDPAGAHVLLNGADTGLISPATLKKLNLGDEYQIRLTLENHKDFVKTIPVVSEDPVRLSATLDPLARGVLDVTSNPGGARIFLDDRDTGLVTPQKIENLEIKKSYRVRLTYPDYSEWSGAAEVKDFSPVSVQATLTPMPTPPQTPSAPPTTLPQTPPVTPPPVVQTPTELPPATPPPVETKLSLSVDSNPAGAAIYKDGQNTGQSTPATLQDLAPGKRVNITLKKKGYEEWKRTITVERNKANALNATLKSVEEEPVVSRPPVETPTPERPSPEDAGKSGTLSVSSSPSGAEVYVNSEFKGKTPLKTPVPAGSIKVVVSKEGLLKQTQTVRVAPGENKNLGTIKLGGMYGSVQVTSSPPRATIFFDGEQIGIRTPGGINNVPRDRKHTLRLKLNGYRDWETTVNLSNQESVKYDVTLEKN